MATQRIMTAVLQRRCRKCNLLFFEEVRGTVMVHDDHGHTHEAIVLRSLCRRCEAWTQFEHVLD